MTFDGFVSSAADNLRKLRSRLAAQSVSSLDTLGDARGRSGEFFVRDAGAVMSLDNGRVEHVYDEHAAALRARMLGDSAPFRRATFQRIFGELASQTTVLNIGAGGDTSLIEALLSRTPNVLSTDFHERVVTALRHEGHRALAFDLAHVTDVLPGAVDCVVGNSVLGYLDPARMQRIVRQLPRVFTKGAIFTFDLAPHGKYFRLADDRDAPPAANESSVSPLVLLDFVRRFGHVKGIDAWAHYAWARGIATDYAVYRALAALFEEEGCSTRLSRVDNAGLWVLRVAHSPMSPLLELSSIERPFEVSDLDDELMKSAVFTPLLFVDRDSGFQLAQSLDLPADRRRSPWLVAKYVAEQQNCRRLTHAELRANVNAIQVERRVARIHDAVRSTVMPSSPSLEKRIALDQTVHKIVLKGESQMSVEQADLYLDTLHGNATSRHQRKAQRPSRRESRR